MRSVLSRIFTLIRSLIFSTRTIPIIPSLLIRLPSSTLWFHFAFVVYFFDSDYLCSGVWDTNSGQTTYLFVDVKTDGNETWPYIVDALKPLNDKGYLTYYNGSTINYGPITVIGTGNTPYEYVSAQDNRYYFYDGPIATLNSSYPNTLNPIASGSLAQIVGDIAPSGLNSTQLALVKKLIDNAHEADIMTRFWEVAWWPVATRNTLYRQLLALGTDLLNADDLELASKFY